MAENKTKENEESVDGFLNGIENEMKRRDSFTILELMKKATGIEPKMWGGSIVGFGSYHYKYKTGREGDAPLVAFSPRKLEFTVYLNIGFDQQAGLLEKLGKHKKGVGCLYIKRVEEVDQAALEELVKRAVEAHKQRNV